MMLCTVSHYGPRLQGKRLHVKPVIPNEKAMLQPGFKMWKNEPKVYYKESKTATEKVNYSEIKIYG